MRNWHELAGDRKKQRSILLEAKFHNRLKCSRKRKRRRRKRRRRRRKGEGL